MLTKTITFEFPLHRCKELPGAGLGGPRTKFIVDAILEKLAREEQNAVDTNRSNDMAEDDTLKGLSKKATPGVWAVEDVAGQEFESPRYQNGAYMAFSDSDCEHHPVADFSCNHTCRDEYECRANAEFVARLVNDYRAGKLIDQDTR